MCNDYISFMYKLPCRKLRLGAETQNGYKWVEGPSSAITGDQAEHRRNVRGPGGKRKRADAECPVKLVRHSATGCIDLTLNRSQYTLWTLLQLRGKS